MNRRGVASSLLGGLFLAASCASEPKPEQPIESVSLLGDPLRRPPLEQDRLAALERDLALAMVDFDGNPDDEGAIIWYGRRLAYLGRYNDALAVFERGTETHPDSFRLLRHAGHRLITLRRFEAAVDRLSRAAELIRGVPDEVEPDGAPNALNIPRSTTHSNIWYHLGLAHFLLGEYEEALAAYRAGIAASTNDDTLVSTTHWLWMTLKRLGRDDEAAACLEPIRADMEIIENQAYHTLCLLYKGMGSVAVLPDAEADRLGFRSRFILEFDQFVGAPLDSMGDAAQAFGIANWLIETGDARNGLLACEAIVSRDPWAAFGTIAAEVEVRRARR